MPRHPLLTPDAHPKVPPRPPGSGEPGSGGAKPGRLRRLRHPLVVADEDVRRITQHLRAGHVDGVERARPATDADGRPAGQVVVTRRFHRTTPSVRAGNQIL
ncbi:hypothetical protein RVR_4340 [Actinacidiphila reveromycinica]|uniref:Uncharacterized protein n=1 Tax=Actinacidiphila reveromycinica TaxID=659352 RepID=A0A7U3VP19_9ACTN|nr:hypothetical protein RVR_4340 [Streptomyces sp. SN-593]